MQILYFKPLQTRLIRSLVFIALLLPALSLAYGGKHHGYGYHGYRNNGYSRHYRHYNSARYSYYPYNDKQRYNYHYRSYQHYQKAYSFSIPANIQVNYSARNLHSTSQVGVNSPAWPALMQDQYHEALYVFAEEAQSHPTSGIPKVGYALAIASSGHLDRGIWAMRRAFRIDSDSLHSIEFDEKGLSLIDNLISRYSTQKNNAVLDHAFMVSALYYLKHDYVAAKISIVNAQQYGDKSFSLINLQRSLDQQLADRDNVNVK